MADRYLLESGAPDGYLLEDGSGVLLLDAVVPASIVDAGGIASAAASGQPTVRATVAATGIASAQALGQPAAAARIGAAGVASAQALGQPVVGFAAASITDAGQIASSQALGEPRLGAQVAAAGVASAQALGQPTIPQADWNIEVLGIDSAEAVGQPVVGDAPRRQVFGGEQRLRRFIEQQNRIAIANAVAASVAALEDQWQA